MSTGKESEMTRWLEMMEDIRGAKINLGEMKSGKKHKTGITEECSVRSRITAKLSHNYTG